MTSDNLKLNGQQLALDYSGHDFKTALPQALSMWCQRIGKHAEFRFEQFREWALNTELLPEPKSANAWGSIPRIAVGMGLIAATGKYEKATALKTHSHPVQVWVVL
jgi:hypothetical protein